jgi:catechol 2,3-dioxygenase-like lactoylglutathione lyase family enzyme
MEDSDMFLSHVRLLVSDFLGCFRFYRDVMGFPVTWGEESAEESYATFRVSEQTVLALFRREAMAATVGTATLPASAAAQDRSMLIFELDGRDAFDRAIERLQRGGTRFVVEPEDYPGWGIRAAYLRDPDGNLIEIESELPKEEMTPELRAALEQYRTTK